jgi:hypothetical protein
LAEPGRYTVSLAKRINGVLNDLGQEQSFDVVPTVERGQPGASPDVVVAFNLRVDDLRRQVQGAGSSVAATLTELGAIKATLLRSGAPAALHEEAHRLEVEFKTLKDLMGGNERRDNYNDIGPVPISARITHALMGTYRSTYGPTPDHVRSIEIAESGFADVRSRMDRVIDTDLPALRARLDEHGVPWTPGRGVPARN